MMFGVLRALFVLIVLLSAWMGYRYWRTQDRRWLQRLRLLGMVSLSLLMVIMIGLFIQRLVM